MTISTWEKKAQVGRDQRDASLTKVEPALEALPESLPLSSQDLPKKYLTSREFELTQDYDAVELLALLRAKTISCEEVTRAFLRRAALAQSALNCVTELMWDEAIERAKYLDSLSEPAGPLHGLPISVKEQHGMKGKSCNAGYVAWIGTPSKENTINDLLYEAGCVFYVRTTEPQTTMHLETCNNITGRTVNPWNRNLTSGGSTGGEGALVGFGGSVFGMGCDIGGSVRGPAACNGIYGFKPTTGRLSPAGMKAANSGCESILATYGPMTRDRESINLFMDLVLGAELWRNEPNLFPKPWTPVTLTKPLKIAVMWDDGVVKPHPPVLRALKDVSESCKSAGMEVVDWVPMDHKRGWDITSRLYWPDGGADARRIMAESGEPLDPMTEWIMTQPGVKSLTVHELWEVCAERDAYREDHAAYWSATGKGDEDEVDVILCPAVPGAAPPHGCAKYWPYTSQWNLVDYPGVIFPVTFVDQEKDKKDESYEPRNADDKFNHDLYSPERYTGAPICLQIVGRRNYDEKVMAALAAVEKAMGRK